MSQKTTSNRFVKPNDPILSTTATEVPIEAITSGQVRKEVEEMLQVAFGEQKERDKPIMVGLAAPQIGISKRIILVDVKADGKGNVGDLRICINPEIVWYSDEKTEWYEGCFSTDRVCGIVLRPTKVRVKAYSPDGIQIEEEYGGYVARIFQHEIDHLNGKEFVTHITDDSKIHWVEDDEFPKYRNNEGWRNWHKKCPREKWNEIKYHGLTDRSLQ